MPYRSAKATRSWHKKTPANRRSKAFPSDVTGLELLWAHFSVLLLYLDPLLYLYLVAYHQMYLAKNHCLNFSFHRACYSPRR